MKKRIATLVCLVSVILMVACSANSSSDDNGTVTIEMAISGSKSEMKIREDTAKAFMEENPNIKIKWVDLGDRRYEKTLTLISGGNAPDILYLNEWVPALAKRNALMPLDELIENDSEFNLDEFYEGLIAGNKYEDKLYALPQEVSPYVVYYNKDLFDEAGVDYPDDNWTQQEFLDTAIELTNAENNQYGFLHENGYNPILGWIFRNNGNLFNEDGTKSGLDSPEVLKALEFINQFIEKGISPNPAEIEATGQGGDAQFRNQQVAMISAGMWLLPPFEDEPLDFNWDVVKMPKAENQDVGAGILNWAISSQTNHKEEAWKVLKYFAGHEGMMEVAASNMALPSTKDEEANQLIIDSAFPENVQAFVDSADNVVMDGYISPFTSELMELVEQETEKMLLGNQSPDETQQNIVNQMNEIMNQ